MLTCEVSLFPLETLEADQIIDRSLEAMKKTGVKHEIGNQSTYLFSEDAEDIWEGIRAIYNEADHSGTEFSLIVNLSNNT